MNGFNFTPVRAMQTETGYVTVEKDGHAMRVVPRAEYRNYASNGWKVTDPDGHVLYDPAPAPARIAKKEGWEGRKVTDPDEIANLIERGWDIYDENGQLLQAGKEQKADWFSQLKEHLQEEVTVINKQGERRTVQRGDLDRCRLQGFFQCDEDGNVVDEYIYASEVADKIRAGQDPYYGFTGAGPGENKTDFTGVR